MHRWIWASCLLGCLILVRAEKDDMDLSPGLMVRNWGVVGSQAAVNGGNQTVDADGAHQTHHVTYGYNAKAGQYPYVAVVLIYYYGYYYHVCGGVIINQHTVLTTANCLRYIRYYKYYVGVGILDLRLGLSNTGAQIIKVSSHVIHPNYDPYGYGYPNDIGALHLDCRIKYNNYVKPARLATRYDGSFSHHGCIILGWGYTDWGYPNILQTAYVWGITNYYCQLFWAISYRARILGTHFCVYRYPVSGCFGDSGGPVVCRGIVAGLISWGEGTCSGCRPTVNTRVSSYARWIKAASTLH